MQSSSEQSGGVGTEETWAPEMEERASRETPTESGIVNTHGDVPDVPNWKWEYARSRVEAFEVNGITAYKHRDLDVLVMVPITGHPLTVARHLWWLKIGNIPVRTGRK